jgi:hypothetical protein
MTLRFNADCFCASTLSSGYRYKNTQGFTLIETGHFGAFGLADGACDAHGCK